MDVRLRAAGCADAEAVATLLIDTRAVFMPYAPAAHTEAEIRAWVRGTLIPAGGVVVAEAADGVVGVMATSATRVDSWIDQMAVTPACVGRGIGSRLLAHALRTLPPPVRLWTFQANMGARRFYARHGFVAVASTDGRGNEERCPDVRYEYADAGSATTRSTPARAPRSPAAPARRRSCG